MRGMVRLGALRQARLERAAPSCSAGARRWKRGGARALGARGGECGGRGVRGAGRGGRCGAACGGGAGVRGRGGLACGSSRAVGRARCAPRPLYAAAALGLPQRSVGPPFLVSSFPRPGSGGEGAAGSGGVQTDQWLRGWQRDIFNKTPPAPYKPWLLVVSELAGVTEKGDCASSCGTPRSPHREETWRMTASREGKGRSLGGFVAFSNFKTCVPIKC